MILSRLQVFSAMPVAVSPFMAPNGLGLIQTVYVGSNLERADRFLARRDFRPPALFRMEAFALAMVMAVNARILAGDANAVRGAGVYYVIEEESMGGNAGEDHFAVNTFVNPQSGRIVAVGNPQNLPEEVLQGTALVTFRIRARSVREMLQNRGLCGSIAEVILSAKDIDPEVRTALRGLAGKSFLQLHPGEADYGDVLDGRHPSARRHSE